MELKMVEEGEEAENKGRYSECPDIGSEGTVRSQSHQFWAPVLSGPPDRFAESAGGVVSDRVTEVADSDSLIAREQDVLQFEIAVRDSPAVKVLDAADDLCEPALDGAVTRSTRRTELFKRLLEVAALDELHLEHEVLRVREGAEQLHEVLVLQRVPDLRLLQERLLELLCWESLCDQLLDLDHFQSADR